MGWHHQRKELCSKLQRRRDQPKSECSDQKRTMQDEEESGSPATWLKVEAGVRHVRLRRTKAGTNDTRLTLVRRDSGRQRRAAQDVRLQNGSLVASKEGGERGAVSEAVCTRAINKNKSGEGRT
jgi:hypothetical protein